MGCWNGTCALTNLPVFYQDPVYVFLVVEQDPRYRTHPTGWWAPAPYFFEGLYNDYGAVENCHGPLLPLLLDSIKDHLVEFDMGKNPYHDIEVKKEHFNIELLFNADHEDRLYIKNIIGTESRVKHLIIKKTVLDSVLQRYTYQQYNSTSSSTEYEYVTVDFNTILQEGLSCLSALKTADLSDIVDRYMLPPNIYSFIEKMKSVVKYSNRVSIPDIEIIKYVENNNFELIEHIIRQLCVLYWITIFLDEIRRPWIPGIGLGSQEGSVEPYQLICNIILEECESIKNMWDNDDDDEEEYE